MGEWAKNVFGKSKYARTGLVIAGTIRPKIEKKILNLFDKIVSSKDLVFHGHLAKKGKKFYPVLTNVYGAPAMMDALVEMHDGGCRNVIFTGYAYGGLFKANLPVGALTLPKKAHHFDGIYGPLDSKKTLATPNKQLRDKLKQILNKNNLQYTEGPNVSVPAVTFQLPHEKYRHLKPKPTTIEMELAACLSRAKEIGMRAVGLLIISDNRESSISGKNLSKQRKKSQLEVLKVIINNLHKLDLPNLKTKKEFEVNEYLASIIEDPEDITNIYKKRLRN